MLASDWTSAVVIRAATRGVEFVMPTLGIPIDGWRLARSGLFEQRHRLDVRGVREHVHRPSAPELVAPLALQGLDVSGERGRVAGDVDEPRRADAAEPAERS